MNEAVIDASVAIKWVILEEGSGAAATLSSRQLSAPNLLLAECANVLWTRARRGEISSTEAIERLRFLGGAPVELVPIETLVEDAASLALELEHPVYDCLYLALARRRDCVMITADQRFTTAVQRHGTYADQVALLGEINSE